MINGKTVKKRKQKDKKRSANDSAMQQNPLALLGFGIVAYVDILYYMIWAFAAFTLIMTPSLVLFG